MVDEKVEQLLSDLRLTKPTQFELVQKIRKSIYAVVPHAAERVMYGGFMFADGAQFCGVFAYTEHVSIEFGRGCDLDDLHQVLEGNGKLRRHIKIQASTDIKAKHLSNYIAQAHKISCGT
jgi:hypothetical protein